MQFQFGMYTLDVDVKKTRAIYQKLPTASEQCKCDGCQNYMPATALLPVEVKQFFESLGIDLRKPAEIYVNCAETEDTLFYAGFFHLCGRLLRGESAWKKVGEEQEVFHWDESMAYAVSEHFKVSFQEECLLLEEEFSAPVLQMEIEATLPWVLPKKNSYL